MLHVERDPARAVQLLIAAAQVKLQLDDYESALDIMMSAALAEDALGNVSEALRLLDFVVEQAVAAKDNRLMSAAYANRGGVRARSGDPAAAEPDFRAGLKAARKMNIGERVPMALLNMGSVMADSGRVGEAIRYYRRGIRAAQGVGSPVEEIRLRRALAVLLGRRRRWRDAERELKAARDAAEALSDVGRAAQVDADSGVVQLMMGDFEQAARSLESAVSGLRQADVPKTLTTALMNLASARRQLGQRERADAAIRQAVDAAATEDHALRAQIAPGGLGLWTDLPAYGSRAASYLRLRLDALRTAGDDALMWESALGAAQLSAAGAERAGDRVLRRGDRCRRQGRAPTCRCCGASAISAAWR